MPDVRVASEDDFRHARLSIEMSDLFFDIKNGVVLAELGGYDHHGLALTRKLQALPLPHHWWWHRHAGARACRSRRRRQLKVVTQQ